MTGVWTGCRAILSRWSGGVFARELRISSRRRRTYILRAAYVLLLLALVYAAWSESFAEATSEIEYLDLRETTGLNAMRIAAMSEAGKRFVVQVSVYQFVALQILAALLLCPGFEEEVRKRTLGVLLTTPLSGRQIAWGKFITRLAVLGGLLACSLPVLALARIFGGVPWQYVVGMLCVTFAGMAMVGAIVLLFATVLRGPVGGLLVGGCVVVVINAIEYISPFVSMMVLGEWLRGDSGGASSREVLLMWLPATGFGLAVALLFVMWAGACLRRLQTAALLAGPSGKRRASNRPDGSPRRAVALKGAGRAAGKMHGSALLWKELRFFLPTKKGEKVLAGMLFVGILVASYGMCLQEDIRHQSLGYMPHTLIYLFAGLLLTTALAGPAMTEERRSSSLALLLTLPVSDGHLIWAKVLGVVYRSGPIWVLLGLHLSVFMLLGQVPVSTVAQVGLFSAALVLFLTGLGLRVGARMSAPASAVILTIGLLVLIWIVMPPAAAVFSRDLAEGLAKVSPAYLYPRAFAGIDPSEDSLAGWPAILLGTLGYGAASLVLIGSARRQLRRGLF